MSQSKNPTNSKEVKKRDSSTSEPILGKSNGTFGNDARVSCHREDIEAISYLDL